MIRILCLFLITSCFNKSTLSKISVKALPVQNEELTPEQQLAFTMYFNSPITENLDTLLQKGFSPNYIYGEMPFLITAIVHEQLESIELLLRHKDIDVNIPRKVKGSDGQSHIKTALHYALEIKDENKRNIVVKMLLEKEGIDVNVKRLSNMTPLMMLAESGYITLTKLLLEKGGNALLKDKNGNRAVYYAREKKEKYIKINIDEEKFKKYEEIVKLKKQKIIIIEELERKIKRKKKFTESSEINYEFLEFILKKQKEKDFDLGEEAHKAYIESVEQTITNRDEYDKYSTIEKMIITAEAEQMFSKDYEKR